MTLTNTLAYCMDKLITILKLYCFCENQDANEFVMSITLTYMSERYIIELKCQTNTISLLHLGNIYNCKM